MTDEEQASLIARTIERVWELLEDDYESDDLAWAIVRALKRKETP